MDFELISNFLILLPSIIDKKASNILSILFLNRPFIVQYSWGWRKISLSISLSQINLGQQIELFLQI